jgi:hypothetical protein
MLCKHYFIEENSFFDTKLLISSIYILFLLDLQSFITQDPGDRDFLVKNLKSFDVPVLNYMGDEGRTSLPFQLYEEVYGLGPLLCTTFEQSNQVSYHRFDFFISSRCVILASILGLTKFLMLLMLLGKF